MIWRAPLSYGCTWEVGKALKNLELLSVIASSNSYAFFRALPTSRVHSSLNGVRQIMNHFFNLHRRCEGGGMSPPYVNLGALAPHLMPVILIPLDD